MMARDEIEKKAKQLFRNFFAWRLEDSPEFASFIGKTLFDDRLESYAISECSKREEICRKFLQETLDLEDGSASAVQKSLRILKYELETFLAGQTFLCYGAPVNCFEGPQINFLQLLTYMPKETVQHLENIIARYKAFPKQAEEIIEVLKFGIEKKATNHISTMHNVLEQFSKLQVPVETSDFYKFFLDQPSEVSNVEWLRLQSEARKTLQEDFLPAMKRIADFIEKDYLPCCRPCCGANSLPNGSEYYRQCLFFYLASSISPKEVHDLGLNEVNRINQEIKQIIKDLGSDLSIQDFFAKMRSNPQVFYKEKEELIEGYQKIVDEEILPKLPDIFHSIPKAKLRIPCPPESQSEGPTAFYRAGSFDGKRPGIFYVNAGNLNAICKYEMRSVALHEALPGHHLQISFVMESPDLPEFQRHIDDKKYFSCPARFPQYNAYSEGWGLYCEYLGKELGLYSDPYTLLGYLSQEMLRACRLVVDTGMHAFGWSMEQAVDFMMTHTASARVTLEKEVNRYVMWPGQACAYKVGEIKIKGLRAEAESLLGAKFSLKDFHDIVLQNMGPLNVLEAEVKKYIKNKQ